MSDRDETALPAGTYRVMDGKLYRVEPGLPPKAVDRLVLVATLRTRAEQAEAAARTYRLAMALALSIPVSSITVESAQAWIDDWKARNDDE